MKTGEYGSGPNGVAHMSVFHVSKAIDSIIDESLGYMPAPTAWFTIPHAQQEGYDIYYNAEVYLQTASTGN